MKMKWYGQSSFMIESESGTVIITDPYAKAVGYPLPTEMPHFVTVSHHHMDHSNTKMFKHTYTLLDKISTWQKDKISIRSIQAYHSKVANEKNSNLIFNFEVDDIRICHCGDLGHLLTKEQLEQIGRVDLLLLPVGGGPMISLDEANGVVHQIKPKLVVPMHYRTKATGLMGLMFNPVNKFIDSAQYPVKFADTFDSANNPLPSQTEILVLSYLKSHL